MPERAPALSKAPTGIQGQGSILQASPDEGRHGAQALPGAEDAGVSKDGGFEPGLGVVPAGQFGLNFAQRVGGGGPGWAIAVQE